MSDIAALGETATTESATDLATNTGNIEGLDTNRRKVNLGREQSDGKPSDASQSNMQRNGGHSSDSVKPSNDGTDSTSNDDSRNGSNDTSSEGRSNDSRYDMVNDGSINGSVDNSESATDLATNTGNIEGLDTNRRKVNLGREQSDRKPSDASQSNMQRNGGHSSDSVKPSNDGTDSTSNDDSRNGSNDTSSEGRSNDSRYDMVNDGSINGSVDNSESDINGEQSLSSGSSDESNCTETDMSNQYDSSRSDTHDGYDSDENVLGDNESSSLGDTESKQSESKDFDGSDIGNVLGGNSGSNMKERAVDVAKTIPGFGMVLEAKAAIDDVNLAIGGEMETNALPDEGSNGSELNDDELSDPLDNLDEINPVKVLTDTAKSDDDDSDGDSEDAMVRTSVRLAMFASLQSMISGMLLHYGAAFVWALVLGFISAVALWVILKKYIIRGCWWLLKNAWRLLRFAWGYVVRCYAAVKASGILLSIKTGFATAWAWFLGTKVGIGLSTLVVGIWNLVCYCFVGLVAFFGTPTGMVVGGIIAAIAACFAAWYYWPSSDDVPIPDNCAVERLVEFENVLGSIDSDLVIKQNAIKINSVLSEWGMSRPQVAAVLGNLTAESGIDSTAIETIYDEKYTVLGPRKQAAIASNFKVELIDAQYAADFPAIEYVGIGLFQWTNGRNVALRDWASSAGKEWHDIDIQLAYFMSEPMYTSRLEEWIATGQGQNISETNDWFRENWLGNMVMAATERLQYSNEWLVTIASYSVDSVYSNSIFDLASTVSGNAAVQTASGMIDECGALSSNVIANNSGIANAMASYSHPTIADGEGNDGTALYLQVHGLIFPGDTYMRACCRSVGTAVRWGGADDNFPKGDVQAQLTYMTSSNKWSEIDWGGSEANLLPGDILIKKSDGTSHVVMYLSHLVVAQHFPEHITNTSMVLSHGSLGTRGPSVGSWYPNLSSFRVFRCVDPETASIYTDILLGI